MMRAHLPTKHFAHVQSNTANGDGLRYLLYNAANVMPLPFKIVACLFLWSIGNTCDLNCLDSVAMTMLISGLFVTSSMCNH